MSMRTSIALAASLAASCAGMTWEAHQRSEAASSYTPDQVRLVQRSLNERGYAMDLTGVYDQRTRDAVMDFQRSRGTDATGDMDAATARALGLRPSDVLPKPEESLQDPVQEDAWRGGGG